MTNTFVAHCSLHKVFFIHFLLLCVTLHRSRALKRALWSRFTKINRVLVKGIVWVKRSKDIVISQLDIDSIEITTDCVLPQDTLSFYRVHNSLMSLNRLLLVKLKFWVAFLKYLFYWLSVGIVLVALFTTLIRTMLARWYWSFQWLYLNFVSQGLSIWGIAHSGIDVCLIIKGRAFLFSISDYSSYIWSFRIRKLRPPQAPTARLYFLKLNFEFFFKFCYS